ncbi:MAG: antitoxin [Actinobacteria bacterium]|nr:antitoxin [Actinomycetota bacterium]
MRTTLAIDDDVLDEARRIAVTERRGLGKVISDLARRSLAPVGIVEVDGLPVFDVPSDAPPITDEQVMCALDEE